MVAVCTSLRRLQRPLLVLLFLCGVAIPITLIWITVNNESEPVEAVGIVSYNHERKPLDYSDSKDKSESLKFHIQEMQQIKLSVQNELRELEKKRSDLYKDVEMNKDSLASLRKQVTHAKSELQQTQAKLAKVQREDNFVNLIKKADVTPVIVPPAPIVLVDLPPREKETGIKPKLTSPILNHHSCTYESCFDFSRCAISKPFNVYVYNLHSPFDRQYELLYSNLLDKVVTSLLDKHAITEDPNGACIFLIVVGPLRTDLRVSLETLPYWGDYGTNHLVLDLSYGNTIQLEKQSINQALLAGVFAPSNEYDILLAPLLKDSDPKAWKHLPSHLPAFRSVLFYFEGEISGDFDSKFGNNEAYVVSSNELEAIERAIRTKSTDKVLLNTKCRRKFDDPAHSHAVPLGEWELCGNSKYRTLNLSKSTFALIIGSKTGVSSSATYTRLIEALHFGSIPVLLGVKSLPFESVIDWSKAAVFVPSPRIGQLHYVLRAIQPNNVLEYRRQGRFLWDTYFSSMSSIVDMVFALVRYKAYYPPPSAKDYTDTKPLLTWPGTSKQLLSPVHQQNFSVYTTRFWNHPPGPFYMYPLTPFTSGPVSGSQYQGLTPVQRSQLPTHVIQGGGVTGPFFQDYWLGNTPDEQFTVVILTYERNTVLVEAIKRLDNLYGLAKVVVVWNSPAPPPQSMEWPTIQAPIDVVSTGRNSLNNRFLPLANIQTEAVLSLDDDVHLRHDEIQFAFRVWREARDRIVGFPGRFHAWDVRHSGWLYNSNYTCELSMVLTGAAFVHKYYLYLYSQWMPQTIRDIVDEYINCEDIAINFLVSHITRKPPLKVTSRWTFRCPGCPENLSTNNEHFNERHICMNRFVEVYGYMPLLYTQFRLDSILFKTRLPSYLEKCYEYV